MFHALCTTYKTEDSKLILCNNWREKILSDELIQFLLKYNIQDLPEIKRDSISNILEGNLEDLIIHIRIIRF